MKTKKRFILRVGADDRKRLTELSKAEDRPMAWIIRDAIKQRHQETFGRLIKQTK